jgi:hypothetical protein
MTITKYSDHPKTRHPNTGNIIILEKITAGIQTPVHKV